MSHLIDMSNGRENMAFVGKTPWHGLGQQLDAGTSLDKWRVEAGLDWEIEKRPVFHGVIDADGNKKAQTIENRVALVRSDTQACLSIMSNSRYKVVQPGEIIEFYRDLVDSSDFELETAGSLKNGSKIWALARGANALRISGTDVIKPYLLLATACDGSMSTVAQFTSVRVVCNNTLSLSVGSNGGKADIRVPHSRDFSADAVKKELGLVDERLATFSNDVDRLAAEKISDETAIKFFIGLYAKTDSSGAVTNEKNLEKITADLINAYRNGPGADLVSARGTVWGAVNAVTNYQDFTARARSNENRFNAGQFGAGAAIKAKAFDTALQLVA